MSHPYDHARSSVMKYGGKVEDYIEIHAWFDRSKAGFADYRHRSIFHHAEGIFWCEEVFGKTIINSNGKHIPTRFIGEQHVREDCGFIPSLKDWLSNIHSQTWMRKGYPLEGENINGNNGRNGNVNSVHKHASPSKSGRITD